MDWLNIIPWQAAGEGIAASARDLAINLAGERAAATATKEEKAKVVAMVELLAIRRANIAANQAGPLQWAAVAAGGAVLLWAVYRSV